MTDEAIAKVANQAKDLLTKPTGRNSKRMPEKIDTAQAVTLYHNPDCGTSRNVLALIRHCGIEPEVIAYLKTPPAREELKALIGRAGLSLRDVLRKKATPYAELRLNDPSLSDDALLDAMMAHPILINRPIVASDNGVKLCRPSDVVLDLLPSRPATEFAKEEGVPFLHDARIAGNDPDLAAALKAVDLPTHDLLKQIASSTTARLWDVARLWRL